MTKPTRPDDFFLGVSIDFGFGNSVVSLHPTDVMIGAGWSMAQAKRDVGVLKIWNGQSELKEFSSFQEPEWFWDGDVVFLTKKTRSLSRDLNNGGITEQYIQLDDNFAAKKIITIHNSHNKTWKEIFELWGEHFLYSAPWIGVRHLLRGNLVDAYVLFIIGFRGTYQRIFSSSARARNARSISVRIKKTIVDIHNVINWEWYLKKQYTLFHIRKMKRKWFTGWRKELIHLPLS